MIRVKPLPHTLQLHYMHSSNLKRTPFVVNDEVNDQVKTDPLSFSQNFVNTILLSQFAVMSGSDHVKGLDLLYEK